MNNLMPHVLGEFPKNFKASREDPDTPTLSSALGGPHRVDFLKAIQMEIKELEQHESGQW
jgi:hypothetical protein